jgi:hypothetical protein
VWAFFFLAEHMPGDYVFTVVIDWLSDPTVVGTQWSLLLLAPVDDTLVHDYKVGIGGNWSPFHVQVWLQAGSLLEANGHEKLPV